MTIQEQHIKILQDVQKINSFAVDNILPEEIDLLLNTFTRKLVDNVVGKLRVGDPTSYQHNQRLIDQIRTLLIKNHTIVPYVEENNIVTVPLPANYRHLVADSSEVCVTDDKLTEERSIYIHIFPLLADGQEYQSLQLEREGISVFDITSYYPEGIHSELNYQLVSLLQNTVPNAYWEEYDGFRRRNCMLFVYENPTELKVKIGEVEQVLEVMTINRQFYKDGIGINAIKPNRLHRDANLSFIQQHPFEKTVWESPLSTISQNSLQVLEDTDFKIKRVIIDYIKNPVTVSHELSIHSDLPEDAQDLITEQTVIHIKAMIQDPSWQVARQENQIINN